jgi:hypothetical protein
MSGHLTMAAVRLGICTEEPITVEGTPVIPREFAVEFIRSQRLVLLKAAAPAAWTASSFLSEQGPGANGMRISWERWERRRWGWRSGEELPDRAVRLVRRLELRHVAAVELEVTGAGKCPLDVLHERSARVDHCAPR